MANAEWFDIQVILTGAPDSDSGQGPGRVILASPSHAFLSLADVIDQAFGRWGEPDGRLFMAEGQEIEAHERELETERSRVDLEPTRLGPELFPGCRFSYIRTGGLTWEHECLVGRYMVDPRVHRPAGRLPRKPFVVDGWGSLPDPQGRTSEFDQPNVAGPGRPSESSTISDEDHTLVSSYCENSIPERVRDEIRLDCERTGNTLSIVERRPPWNPELIGPEWTSSAVAQFTRQLDGSWTLQCQLSDGRWHEYDPLPASPKLARLLAEVDSDPSGIFWG